MGRGPSIEGRKNAEDARRAKVFTKLIREITIAARGGADPAINARLRLGIEKALAANMTRDTIERAVKRGSGAEGADNMEELRYEGYAPGGVALIIDCMTDNSVRTVADVRHALNKHGGNLGTTGSVAFQFNRRGELLFATPDSAAEDRLMEIALEAGAEDVQSSAGRSLVLCAANDFESVKAGIEAAGLKPESADIVLAPDSRITVEGPALEDLQDLLDRLEALDDVQDVHHNAILPEPDSDD